jgi:hypothetical protein
MFEQVKATAGIHMSSFKTKPDTDESVNKDGATGSDWKPMPSFLVEMQRAEQKAGV